MKEQVRVEPKIVSAAEKQMQAWARSAELARQRAGGEARATVNRFGPFLCVSRECGSGGGAVAQMVAEKLGWEVLGRELLDQIAQRYRLPRPMLEVVDETKANWAHSILGTWMDPHFVSHEKYITHLRCIVLAAAHLGRVVFLGRGAQFFMPPGAGLAIRVVAPEPYRIAQLAQKNGINEKEARRMMKQADEGRRDFVARYFHHDIADPCLYNLVVNVANHGPNVTANVIADLCSRLETRAT
ncbi:MAG: cytidylate kinase-like family protein [Pirellulales bacterium]|nr:cytidylate kinase-like family protein [Pirellulales bacterium]